jgi:DNA polymerase V
MSENKKIIVLVDANNFFVSCERAFNPSLQGKPVVVLSNNDGNVIARSNEAKQLGIRMGEVFYQRKHWYDQNGVYYFSSNYTVYYAKSRQVMSVLDRFTKTMEYYSVDEAWLDLSHIGDEAVEAHCREIRRFVLEETGIPCSFGIGRNKTQAKLAVSQAKMDDGGVYSLINHPAYDEILLKTPIDQLWGINRRLCSRLQALGIHTARDLARADAGFIRKKTNVNVAKIVYELRHRYCFELDSHPAPPKRVSVSLSFSCETSDLKDIQEATACYIARAAARLRMNNLAARHVTVVLSTNRYSKTQPFSMDYGEALLKSYSIYTPGFIKAAQAIVRRCFDPRKRYHKVTVMLDDLVPLDERQITLWDTRDQTLMTLLMGLVDVLNERFGEGSFRFKEEGSGQRWKVRRQYLSGATIENMNLENVEFDRLPNCRIGTDAVLIEGLQLH